MDAIGIIEGVKAKTSVAGIYTLPLGPNEAITPGGLTLRDFYDLLDLAEANVISEGISRGYVDEEKLNLLDRARGILHYRFDGSGDHSGDSKWALNLWTRERQQVMKTIELMVKAAERRGLVIGKVQTADTARILAADQARRAAAQASITRS
jgi:hypothetical protein